MRIIAGKHKGRILKSLNYEGTRPTADRVKEALFSKIQYEIKEKVVLDLFSGTGSLSFEALSRGAKIVYGVDSKTESVKLIKENNELLKENLNILQLDFNQALKQFIKENIKFDVIFLDPPYKTNLGEEALLFIANNNLLLPNGIIVFEHDKEKLNMVVPQGLRVYDQKKYGNTYLTYITEEL